MPYPIPRLLTIYFQTVQLCSENMTWYSPYVFFHKQKDINDLIKGCQNNPINQSTCNEIKHCWQHKFSVHSLDTVVFYLAILIKILLNKGFECTVCYIASIKKYRNIRGCGGHSSHIFMYAGKYKIMIWSPTENTS